MLYVMPLSGFLSVCVCVCFGGRLSVGSRFLFLAENKQINKPRKSDSWDLVYFFYQ